MELLVTRMVRDSGYLHTTPNILVVSVGEFIVIYLPIDIPNQKRTLPIRLH